MLFTSLVDEHYRNSYSYCATWMVRLLAHRIHLQLVHTCMTRRKSLVGSERILVRGTASRNVHTDGITVVMKFHRDESISACTNKGTASSGEWTNFHMLSLIYLSSLPFSHPSPHVRKSALSYK